MDQALFALPILPDKTTAARAFLQELGGPRQQDLATCGQTAGIAKESPGPINEILADTAS